MSQTKSRSVPLEHGAASRLTNHGPVASRAERRPTLMATIARKSDGRRIFTEEFKRSQIGRVTRGELTIAELGRKLGVARSLLQRWKRTMQADGVPGDSRRGASAGDLRADHYIRELQLLVGKQTVELEHLRSELAALRKGRRPR